MATNVWISLLRGANVGGHNIGGKGQLVSLYESLGYGDVRTHIQSGNVLFTSAVGDPGKLARDIESALDKQLGLRVSVILRTSIQLRATIAANPFPAESEENPSRVMVGFFDRTPLEDDINNMKPLQCAPDKFRIVGAEVFCHFPNASGNSKLNSVYFEKQLDVNLTMRNWRVVNKLLELAEEG